MHGDRIVYTTERGLAVFDGGSRQQVVDHALAISPDRSTLFDLAGESLVGFSIGDGHEVSRVSGLPAGMRPRVVSAAGKSVVVSDAAPGEQWLPAKTPGRATTTIAVVDLQTRRVESPIRLQGNFEPDAYDDVNRFLYVLEHLPPKRPDRYRVRRIENGRPAALLTRDKRVLPAGTDEEMRGNRRDSVLSPKHDRIYTLYTHQPGHLHSRDLIAARRGVHGKPVHAFVHVLALEEGWAYCVDLPEPFGLGQLGGHALVLSPDGLTLHVLDLTSRRIVYISTERLSAYRWVHALTDGYPADKAATALSPNGERLFIGSSDLIRVFDMPRMSWARKPWRVSGPVRGIGLDGSGKRLYVGIDGGRVEVFDSTSGKLIDRFEIPGMEVIRDIATA